MTFNDQESEKETKVLVYVEYQETCDW